MLGAFRSVRPFGIADPVRTGAKAPLVSGGRSIPARNVRHFGAAASLE